MSAVRATATNARWVSETRDERFGNVVAVELAVRTGRIEIGSRGGRQVRVRTTLAQDGWRARAARLRAPAVPGALASEGVLRLSCPDGQARVQLDVPAGVRVQAAVTDGDLTLWGVAGDLRLSVGAGTLAGRDLSASEVVAENGEGEVNLHFAVRPSVVRAESASGPVLLVLPAGTYRVDTGPAAPGGAATEVTVTVDDDASASIRTRSGGRTAVLAAAGSEPI